MLLLANFCCCGLFRCWFFGACTSFATKGLGNEKGNFFVIDWSTTQACYLLTSFLLSHVLKEAEREASHVGKRHRIVHIHLEFIRSTLERIVTQGLQDLIECWSLTSAWMSAKVNESRLTFAQVIREERFYDFLLFMSRKDLLLRLSQPSSCWILGVLEVGLVVAIEFFQKQVKHFDNQILLAQNFSSSFLR